MFYFSICRMDYCGIIILIVASFVPWLHFAFYRDLVIQIAYLIAVGLFGAVCSSVVIRDEFSQPRYRTMRFG